MRSNTKPCGHYIDKGWCYFGKECYYHHPHPSSKEHRTMKSARANAIAAAVAVAVPTRSGRARNESGHRFKKQG